MQGHTYPRLVVTRVVGVLVVASACLAVAPSPGLAGDAQPAASKQALPEAAAPEGAPGMMIYVDPQTGALLPRPAPGSVPFQIAPQQQNALSTSGTGLVEVRSSAPGGGVKVDLQGRFQSPLFATIDTGGQVRIRHLNEPPDSADKQ